MARRPPGSPRETEQERRDRLVAHATKMREAQKAKKMTAHVCPPSETDEELRRLWETLDTLAPVNHAPLPIAMAYNAVSMEYEVDVEVIIPRVIEYDSTGTGPSLSSALANARRGILSQAAEAATDTR